MGRRIRGGGKRGFKAYSSAKQAGWDRPGGGGFPGDPFELTMKRVRLSSNFQPFGMDESRKRNMRRMLWYWQWSRDWQWRQLAAVSGIQPDKHAEPVVTIERLTDEAPTHLATVAWYWQWPKKQKSQRTKRDLKKAVAKRGSELMQWMVSLNPRQIVQDAYQPQNTYHS